MRFTVGSSVPIRVKDELPVLAISALLSSAVGDSEIALAIGDGRSLPSAPVAIAVRWRRGCYRRTVQARRPAPLMSNYILLRSDATVA